MRVSATLAAGLLVALAGCTSDPGEEPMKPEPQIGAAEASAVAQLKQRPADLSLAGVKPCDLFPRAALDELEIDREPRDGTAADGARTCMLSARSTEPVYDLQVSAMTDAGVEAWINGRKAQPGAVTVTPVTIAEFPAVVVRPKDAAACEVAVGVDQGQAVHVRFGTGYRGEFDHHQACTLSQQAAAVAVTALREQKG